MSTGVGFGSLVWKENDQRGSLIATLRDGPGPDIQLTTRYISRARPDLSSSAMLLDTGELDYYTRGSKPAK